MYISDEKRFEGVFTVREILGETEYTRFMAKFYGYEIIEDGEQKEKKKRK